MIASIARRYARALLDIAVELSVVDEIGEQLGALSAAVAGSPDLATLLRDPAFTREQRHQIFDALAAPLGLTAPVVNGVKLLADRGHGAELAQVARIYQDLADDRAGRARAELWTASAISHDQAAALSRALSEAVHRQVTVRSHVDGTLLGGAVAQVGSFRFDGSIRGRMRELRHELKRA